MGVTSYSDIYFVSFMISLVIFILLLTSGVTVSMPGLFNITNRSNSKDTTKYNDINIYMKTRSQDTEPKKKPSGWSKVMTISMFTTLIYFLLFITAEFL